MLSDLVILWTYIDDLVSYNILIFKKNYVYHVIKTIKTV